MLIIQQPKEWSHEFTCSECGAKLRAGIDDLKVQNVDYVVCIYCGTEEIIQDVPKSAKARARFRNVQTKENAQASNEVLGYRET